MEEDIAIIDQKTKEQKIKDFFLKYKKIIYILLLLFIISLFSIFFYKDYKVEKNKELASKYLFIQANYSKDKNDFFSKELISIINKKNKTYSILALLFLVDNEVLDNKSDVNFYFEYAIKNIDLDKDSKNLLIFKKAIFNSEFANENELLKILSPIINSESIWKPHSLLLLGDYFLSKGEKEKARDFFNQILINKQANQNIISQSQARLRRLLSE